MTTSATTGAGPDRIDARLLTLDPDLEDLFAEVEQILCAAAVPRGGTARRLGPGQGIGRGPPHPDTTATGRDDDRDVRQEVR